MIDWSVSPEKVKEIWEDALRQQGLNDDEIRQQANRMLERYLLAFPAIMRLLAHQRE